MNLSSVIVLCLLFVFFFTEAKVYQSAPVARESQPLCGGLTYNSCHDQTGFDEFQERDVKIPVVMRKWNYLFKTGMMYPKTVHTMRQAVKIFVLISLLCFFVEGIPSELRKRSQPDCEKDLTYNSCNDQSGFDEFQDILSMDTPHFTSKPSLPVKKG